MQTVRCAMLGWGVLWVMASVAHAAQTAPTRVIKKPVLVSKTVLPTKTAVTKKPVVRKPSAPESVAPPAPPEEVVPLSAELLEVADQVYVGTMSCELGTQVVVAADPIVSGRFVMELGRQRYHMTPVLTSTGAVRLEDVHAGAVWLQLPNKSMLMSQKLGKRLADDCTGAEQTEIARALSRSPVPGILEARAPNPVPSAVVPEGGAPVVVAEPAGIAPETATK